MKYYTHWLWVSVILLPLMLIRANSFYRLLSLRWWSLVVVRGAIIGIVWRCCRFLLTLYYRSLCFLFWLCWPCWCRWWLACRWIWFRCCVRFWLPWWRFGYHRWMSGWYRGWIGNCGRQLYGSRRRFEDCGWRLSGRGWRLSRCGWRLSPRGWRLSRCRWRLSWRG